MKILFVIRSLQRAGAERQLVTLANCFVAHDHTVGVATFYSGGALEADLHIDVRLLPLHKGGRWDMLGFERRLLRSVRDFAPDVVHTYMSGANLIAAQLRPLLGAPLVWGVLSSYVDMRVYDWAQRAAYRMEPLAARIAADLIICNSQAGRAAAVRLGYPAQRTIAVDNGIDTARFQPNPAARAALRAQWEIAADQPLIGIIGRLDPMKDHASFLQAAAQVRAQQPACRFVVVGHDPAGRRPELEALAATLGLSDTLDWAPARGDIEAVYPALDLLVSASAFGEGFSNVIAEAMACGVPCAVTNVGDSARIVGDTGAVAPPGDPAALAAAVLAVLARRAPDLALAARARVVQNFSVQRMVERTEAALLRVVEKQRTGNGERGTA